MKPRLASSETAEPPLAWLDTRFVLPTTIRKHSSISSSLFSLHAQYSDDQRLGGCSVMGLIDVEAEDLGTVEG